jgi:hypothetical protein
MAKTAQPILIASILAAAALARLRFAGFDGNVAGAGAKALGVTEAATAQGEQAPVSTHGILLVTAGGVIAAGAEVEVGADGKAVTKAAGVSNGYALDAAAADGDIIRIVRGI